MRLSIITGGLLAIMTVSSCSSLSHTAQTADVDTRVYNLTVADMDVSENRAAKTSEWKWTPLSSVSLSAQKETATAELLKEHDADVLVEPQYTIKRRGLFRGGSVTVTGYPAKYANFRTMSKEDAEKIAALDGKMSIAYPMIATSSNKRPIQAAKTVEVPLSRHSFIDLVGGAVIDPDGNFNAGPQLGLMYGSYGRHWGWYGKLMWTHVSAEERHSSQGYSQGYSSTDDVTANSFLLTVGGIKTITRNFNVFAGLGFGYNFSLDYNYSYSRSYYYGSYHWSSSSSKELEKYAALPFEVGFQWTRGKINVIAGCTGVPNFNGNADTKWNINPFVGVGITL